MYKVLMTLMYMDIGGAETHVLELCKALRKHGCEVFVASNGGAFVKELAENGITHYKVPLHTKNLSSVYKSYKMLKKIIIDNDIKLVHAHARIAAFICAMLQKKLGFRFVTTVHGVYRMAFPFNIISRWGDKSLAISDDLRQYLIEGYGVAPENITDTVNGIDTGKFAPDTPRPEADAEFPRKDGVFRVVYVSRMDADVNRTAYKIMDAMKIVREKAPDAELLIVGGGDDEENIAREVTERNARAGEDFILFAGKRTNINQYLAGGDVFAGISRAALEAMSAGLPVVLAGDPGFLGIFTEERLESALETNFTCRGCEEATPARIAEAIAELMAISPEERAAIGAFGREIVEKHYSVDRMRDDALAVYESLRVPPRKPVDIVISGYYGFRNNGDDILLKSIIEGLRGLRPDINIVVLSRRPKDTREIYGVEAVNRFNFFAVSKLLKKTGLLVSGGGSLIQDSTSTQSILYYIWVINAARRRGAKNMLYANGIGPVRRNVNKRRAKNALDMVDLITLRDAPSLDELKKFGVDGPEIVVTADAAFSMRETDENEAAKILAELKLSGVKFFGVSVRAWRYNRQGFEEEIAAFADYVSETYGAAPLFIPMRPADDAEISRRIISLMRRPAYFLGTDYTADGIIGIVGKAEFILGMRLHTVVYAGIKGTPVIGLVYDPKVKAMMDTLGQSFYMDVADFNSASLRAFADAIFAGREAIAREISGRGKEEIARAEENNRLCVGLLEKPLY